MVKKNLSEQLDRIIGIMNQKYDSNKKDLTPIIHSLLDKMFVSPNKEVVCGIEVTHPEDREVLPGQNKYKTYKVKIYFVRGVKRNRVIGRDYEELMDEAHDLILNMMGIFIDIFSTDVSSCKGYEEMKKRGLIK